jgi:hypothetical protein
MADLKISALPASTTPLAGTEVLPIVQSGVTRQVSVANLTAGRAISATQLTLTTGNLIVASGQGVDFSATPGTGTSELLADYEEGNWTPNQGSGLTVVGAFSSSGTYTKVGRLVTATGILFGATSIAVTATNAITSNLPFTQATGNSGGTCINAATTSTTIIYASGTTVYSTSATVASNYIFFLITYQV